MLNRKKEEMAGMLTSREEQKKMCEDDIVAFREYLRTVCRELRA